MLTKLTFLQTRPLYTFESCMQFFKNKTKTKTMTISASCFIKLLLVCKLAPRIWMAKRDRRKEVDHFRWVGGKFINKRNLHTRPVLGCRKTNRFLHPPTRISSLFIVYNLGQSFIQYR